MTLRSKGVGEFDLWTKLEPLFGNCHEQTLVAIEGPGAYIVDSPGARRSQLSLASS